MQARHRILTCHNGLGTEKPERTDFNAAFDAIDTTVASHLAESASKHIYESGTNPNGNYIKFDDGTMICHVSANITDTTYGIKTVTLPHTFYNQESMKGFALANYIASSTGMVSFVTELNISNTSSIVVRVLLHANTTVSPPSTAVNCKVLVIGRWKA